MVVVSRRTSAGAGAGAGAGRVRQSDTAQFTTWKSPEFLFDILLCLSISDCIEIRRLLRGGPQSVKSQIKCEKAV